MKDKKLSRLVIAAGLLAAAAIVLPANVGHAARVKAFTLKSTAFRDNGKMAQKYAGNATSNPNCDGQNVSIPLAWTNPPAGTKSFALLMQDPDGQKGLSVIHWVAYGIPASKTGLAEGEASVATPDIVEGKNTPANGLYYGPCPPHHERPHHYIITLIATDLAPGTPSAGMTKDELFGALKGHALGSTSLIGRYGH